MSCDPAFAVALAVACLAVGILIGLALVVCYRKLFCGFPPSSGPRYHQHFDDESVDIDVRRDRRSTEPQIHAVSGNPNVQSFPNYPALPEITSPGAWLQSRASVDRRSSDDTGRQILSRSEPVPNRRVSGSLNPLNKKTQKYSSSYDGYGVTARGSQRSKQKGDEVPVRRMSHTGYERFSGGLCANIQGLENSGNPTKWTIPASQALPPVEYTTEERQGDEDFDDSTLVKMLAPCPDDIRELFIPSGPSKTTLVREKKLVYICKMLNDKGGTLELENMGISLLVPPGAIPFNQRSPVTLVLNWDLNDNPYMEKKEALVSPVVFCGPHGSTFDKPCILKFKHCAHNRRFARILSSEIDLFDKKAWQYFNPVTDADTVADDDEDEPIHQSGVSLDVNECEVEVSHFSLFTCTMKSKHLSLKKWIQVAVFTHDIDPIMKHQQIRIYFLNKTPCALQWAIQNEAEFNFSLACPDTTFQFTEYGEDMMVHLKYISEGWEVVTKDAESTVRSIFFEEIWHGACPHAQMCFRKIDHRSNNASSKSEADEDLRGSKGSNRLDDSGKSAAAWSEISGRKSVDEAETSEISIELRLKQHKEENLEVPLNVLVHSLKVKISDTQVKVIDEGSSDQLYNNDNNIKASSS